MSVVLLSARKRKDYGIFYLYIQYIYNLRHNRVTKHFEERKHSTRSHDAIFLATCNAILPLGDVNLEDVKLVNTSFDHCLLIYFQHTKHLSQIYIS